MARPLWQGQAMKLCAFGMHSRRKRTRRARQRASSTLRVWFGSASALTCANDQATCRAELVIPAYRQPDHQLSMVILAEPRDNITSMHFITHSPNNYASFLKTRIIYSLCPTTTIITNRTNDYSTCMFSKQFSLILFSRYASNYLMDLSTWRDFILLFCSCTILFCFLSLLSPVEIVPYSSPFCKLS